MLRPVERSSVSPSSAVYDRNKVGAEQPQPGDHKLPDQTQRLCPHCARSYSPGELICSYCGIPFVNVGKTNKINDVTSLISPKNGPIGDVIAHEEKPIWLTYGDTQICVPVTETIVIGRQSKVPGDPQPDVQLNMFKADELGVSRQHIKLIRRQDLIYIADMGSSNGTFLNGRPLLRNCLRVLRDGDELQLGLLKLKVRFE